MGWGNVGRFRHRVECTWRLFVVGCRWLLLALGGPLLFIVEAGLKNVFLPWGVPFVVNILPHHDLYRLHSHHHTYYKVHVGYFPPYAHATKIKSTKIIFFGHPQNVTFAILKYATDIAGTQL